MNRLVKAEYSNGNAAYQYDASGNRAQEDLTDKRASEGVNGRANDDNPNKPIFDLVYDEQDRLRLVRDLATKQELARYEYNFRGQRVKKTTSSGAIISTYDSNNLVAEYDGQLNPLANYVNGIDPIVCNDLKNGNTSYYQYNHLGSVVNLVGSGGQLLNSYRYDVWGVIRDKSSLTNSNNRLTFTAQQYDDETGLYCFGQGVRYMDASIGRFLQRDPMFGQITNPLSLNRYSYAFNSPVRFMDPSGLEVISKLTRDVAKNIQNGKASTLDKFEGYDLKTGNLLGKKIDSFSLSDSVNGFTFLDQITSQTNNLQMDGPIVLVEKTDSLQKIESIISSLGITGQQREAILANFYRVTASDEGFTNVEFEIPVIKSSSDLPEKKVLDNADFIKKSVGYVLDKVVRGYANYTKGFVLETRDVLEDTITTFINPVKFVETALAPFTLPYTIPAQLESAGNFPTVVRNYVNNATFDQVTTDTGRVGGFIVTSYALSKLGEVSEKISVGANGTNGGNIRVKNGGAEGTGDEVGLNPFAELTESELFQKLSGNFRREVSPKEIKGARPFRPGGQPGHARSGHNVKPDVQAELLNNPERIFSGINKNGRPVDVYYRDGSVIITELGDKTRVITAYGNIVPEEGAKPKSVDEFINNPNYVEINVKGPIQVTYPNQQLYELNNYPSRFQR